MLANDIIEKGLSVRQIEEIAKEEEKKKEVKRKTRKRLSEYKGQEKAFKKMYSGSRLRINEGRITINVCDEEQLKEIIEKLLK